MDPTWWWRREVQYASGNQHLEFSRKTKPSEIVRFSNCGYEGSLSGKKTKERKAPRRKDGEQ